MYVRTALYKADGDTAKDFSSVILSLIYLCFLGFWGFVCYKNQPYVHKIHILMGILLAMGTLDLICGPADKQYATFTRNAHGWDVVIYIIKFFRHVLAYTVIVLVGAGWSFLKQRLNAMEKMVLIIVIPLNVASKVIKEANPFHKDLLTWSMDFLFVDSICILSLVIPILQTWDWLYKAIKADGKAASLEKFDVQFVQFYTVVALHSIVMGFGVNHYESTSNETCNAAEEIFSLVFCMVMFYMFRPGSILEIEDDEEEEVLNGYCILDIEDEVEVPRCAKGKKNVICVQSGQKMQKLRKRGKNKHSQVFFIS
ncbi:hypothetical protein L1887_30321 [Cichorium endivia]|nr:hypothetical protein L1887_30321 [Cichorium endivia]